MYILIVCVQSQNYWLTRKTVFSGYVLCRNTLIHSLISFKNVTFYLLLLCCGK